MYRSIPLIIFSVALLCWSSSAYNTALRRLPGTNFATLDQFRICLNLKGVSFVPRDSNSERYKTLNFQWNTFNYIEPLGYILPATTGQTQRAIQCAKTYGIHLVAKSGGHSYVKYSFGDNNTMILDLQKLRNIRIDKQTSTAIMGTGVLMAQLYYHLWKFGDYVTPGGICASVALGGYALGGGLGWLSSKYGLMSDSIEEMKLVTARGNVLTVNSRQHSDLFWALRGAGGGNFGIVTEFQFKIQNASNIRYHFIRLNYLLNDFVTAFNAAQRYYLENVNSSSCMIFSIRSTGIGMVILDFNLSNAEVESLIAKFPPPVTKSSETLSSFVDIVVRFQPMSKVLTVEELKNFSRADFPKRYGKTKSYFVSKIISSRDILTFSKVMTQIPPDASLSLESFGGAVHNIPRDSTAFVHRNALYSMEFKITSNVTETRPWFNDFKRVISILENGESYQNFADGTLSDYLQRYYGSALQRLRCLKAKYDPTNFFSFPQSIPLAYIGSQQITQLKC